MTNILKNILPKNKWPEIDLKLRFRSFSYYYLILWLYTTDFSRSWLIPDADPLLVEIKDILYQAQQNMIKSIKVGMKFSDLFNLGFNQVRESIPNYTRGHLGHSISLGPQTAEYPVINKDNHDTIKENMILCVEVPLYISGFGGFNIEDMILVTKDGAEVLSHRSPHYLEFEKRK